MKYMKRFFCLALILSLCIASIGCGKKKEEAKKTANDFREGVTLSQSLIELVNGAVTTSLAENEAVKQTGIDFFKKGFFDGLRILDTDIFKHIEYLNEDSSDWKEVVEYTKKSFEDSNGETEVSSMDVVRNGEDDYTLYYNKLETANSMKWLNTDNSVTTAMNCTYDANHGWAKVVVTGTVSNETVEYRLFELYRNGDVYVIQTEKERLYTELEKETDEKGNENWKVKKFIYSKLGGGNIKEATLDKESTVIGKGDSFYLNADYISTSTKYGRSLADRYCSDHSVFTTFKGDSSWVTEYKDRCALIVEYEDNGMIVYNRNKMNDLQEKWTIKDGNAFCEWLEN